jgi:hypothetical protein
MPRTRRDGRPRLYLVGEAPADPAASPTPRTEVDDLLSGAAEDGDDAAGLERDLSFIDQVLAIQPVPQDVLVWRAVTADSFELPWRELPGTLHQEVSYLAVALVRYPALRAAEAVLHLRVPAGIPGVYLNPFDHGDRLPAPTLLLGRGLAVFVHEVRRQEGQWYVAADLVPPPPAGWGERQRVTTAVPGAAAGDAARAGTGPPPAPVDAAVRGPARGPARRHVPEGWNQLVQDRPEGGGHGR